MGVLQQYNQYGQPLGVMVGSWNQGVAMFNRRGEGCILRATLLVDYDLRLKVPLHEAIHVGRPKWCKNFKV